MKTSMYRQQVSDRFIVLLKDSNNFSDNMMKAEILEGRERQKGIA
jgi:hypothetical protein